MGVYLNPGNEAFRECVTDELYVDKTELIAHMNMKLNKARLKYVCVSRPRRFGKSMAADMLVAYYGKNCDSRELFAGRKIEKADSYEAHLNRHNVIRLDIQRFLFQKSHFDIFIDEIQKLVIREVEMAYVRGDFHRKRDSRGGEDLQGGENSHGGEDLQGRGDLYGGEDSHRREGFRGREGFDGRESFGGEFPDSQYGLPGVLSQIHARTGLERDTAGSQAFF